MGDKWRETNEGRSSQEQARMEITKGDKWRETNEGRSGQEQARMEITKGDKWRQEQPRAGQNGDHKGGQMKRNKWRQERPRAGQNGDHEGRQMKAGAAKSRPEWRSRRGTNEGKQMKAGAAKSRPEWRSQRETKEGRQMKAGAAKSRPEWRQRKGDKWKQEQPRAGQNGDHKGGQIEGNKWRQERPRAGQNGDHEGRQMKAGAAKSRPEWRSRRETKEGRQMKAGAAKSRPEWRSQRETKEGRQMKAGAAKSRPEWRSQRETNEGRQMKAGAAKSRPEWRSCREANEGRPGGSGRDFGDQQPSLWEVRTPIASSYLWKNHSGLDCRFQLLHLVLESLAMVVLEKANSIHNVLTSNSFSSLCSPCFPCFFSRWGRLASATSRLRSVISFAAKKGPTNRVWSTSFKEPLKNPEYICKWCLLGLCKGHEKWWFYWFVLQKHCCPAVVSQPLRSKPSTVSPSVLRLWDDNSQWQTVTKGPHCHSAVKEQTCPLAQTCRSLPYWASNHSTALPHRSFAKEATMTGPRTEWKARGRGSACHGKTKCYRRYCSNSSSGILWWPTSQLQDTCVLNCKPWANYWSHLFLGRPCVLVTSHFVLDCDVAPELVS